jgi:hypothetical protein
MGGGGRCRTGNAFRDLLRLWVPYPRLNHKDL